MPTNTKITISPQELQLVNNSNWILTKHSIIDNVIRLFGYLAEKMKVIIENEKNGLPETVIRSEPKISKGEKYLQLPYVLLDLPKCFDGENIFAVRTLFWWGNFFSCTLHLAGTYKKTFEEALILNCNHLLQSDYYICINDNQWHHHFEKENYIEVKTKTPEELKVIIQQQSFIKIAVKFPLEQWNEMPGLLESSFSDLIKLVKI